MLIIKRAPKTRLEHKMVLQTLKIHNDDTDWYVKAITSACETSYEYTGPIDNQCDLRGST